MNDIIIKHEKGYFRLEPLAKDSDRQNFGVTFKFDTVVSVNGDLVYALDDNGKKLHDFIKNLCNMELAKAALESEKARKVRGVR